MKRISGNRKDDEKVLGCGGALALNDGSLNGQRGGNVDSLAGKIMDRDFSQQDTLIESTSRAFIYAKRKTPKGLPPPW